MKCKWMKDPKLKDQDCQTGLKKSNTQLCDTCKKPIFKYQKPG